MIFDLAHLPEIQRVEEAALVDNGRNIGFHVTTCSQDGVLGGGINENLNTARRIAIAETLERKIIAELRGAGKSEEFLLNDYPTSCGFAAGFDDISTRQRAMAEGIERWAWSKWADEEYLMTENPADKVDFDPICSFLAKSFDSLVLLTASIDSSDLISFGMPRELIFSVAIGIKDGGVFPGSRISEPNGNLWQHPIVEAWRHLIIFSNLNKKTAELFPFNRIYHFGKNGFKSSKKSIHGHRYPWPKPQTLLVKKYETRLANAHVWRCLMKDYKGWHIGDQTRFVY